MGTYTFRWESPAETVSVQGSWDDWHSEHPLKKENGVFQAQLDLPSAERTYYYKFIVNGKWDFDHKLITENDTSGNTNNVLPPDHIQPFPAGGRSHHGAHDMPVPTAAAISTVGAGATTAALAGQVPLEKDRNKAAAAGEVPLEKDRNKAAAAGDEEDMPGAFPATPGAGTGALDQGSQPKSGEAAFGVNPIPATSGYGNPVHLKPGEPVPAASTLTSNTVDSTVQDGNAVKDHSGAAVAAGTAAAGGAAAGIGAGAGETRGPFSVEPASKSTIPESGLPIGSDVRPLEKDQGPVVSSAGATSTTAQLAGQVPLEPRGKAEVVDDGDEKPAKSAAEADAEKPGIIGAIAAGGAALAGSAATHASNLSARMQEALSGINNGQDPLAVDDPNVPDEVKDSIKAAHTDPEAVANPAAVREKAALETELTHKVDRTNESGEPAPTTSASTSAIAPVDAATRKIGDPTIADEGTLPAIAVASGAAGLGVAGASAAGTSNSASSATGTAGGAHVVHDAFKNDDLGHPDHARKQPTTDPRQTSPHFENDPLGPGESKTATTATTATGATNDTLHQKAVASGLNAAASAPSASTGKNPAAAAAAAAMGAGAAASTTGAAHHKAGPGVTTGVSSGPTSTVSKPADSSSGAAPATPSTPAGAAAGTSTSTSTPTTTASPSGKDADKERKKKNRRSFMQKVKDAFTPHKDEKKATQGSAAA